MCYQRRLAGVQSDDESLMSVSIDVIGKNPSNDTLPLDLKTAPSTLKGTGEYLVALVSSVMT